MTSRYWVVIPAAGIGRRMTTDTPKQYLRLAGRTVIEWALAPFLARKDIAGAMVVLAEDDSRFSSLPIARDARVRTTPGGAERTDSVLRGLQALAASDDDWILVHDAARPCLQDDDLAKLITELTGDEVGGLLAAPVTDTLKSIESGRVQSTVARDKVWRALTPQLFRFGVLQRALSAVRSTDESMAVESLGLRPRVVEGRADNIKITVPEDLRYAEFILARRIG